MTAYRVELQRVTARAFLSLTSDAEDSGVGTPLPPPSLLIFAAASDKVAYSPTPNKTVEKPRLMRTQNGSWEVISRVNVSHSRIQFQCSFQDLSSAGIFPLRNDAVDDEEEKWELVFDIEL